MTFNRLANTQYSRLKNKILFDPSQEPTIPVIGTAFQPITEEDYLVLGQFLDTDLLNGEIAINTASDRVWVRSDDSIIELSVSGSASSLTGGNGITIGSASRIDLGGTLDQPTILLGNSQTFDLGTTASQLSFFRVNAIQSYEEYKFAGEGLTITQNPGTFLTDLDYSTSSGYRSFIQQSPAVISSVASLGLTESQITQSSTQINILTITNGVASGFAFNSAVDSFNFTDNRLTPRGLEYQDDYSTNFSVRSLIDKGYLDSVVSGLSFDLINDTTPQLGGNLDLNNFNIGGTGSIDIDGNVIANMIQVKGGVGTQGEMTWNTDEETIQLVMDGVTQHIGQDTYIHARNNTASTILKGTPVMATGTLGASGRITIAPMIADGSVESRFYIGIAAEDITAGTDGQVMSFGKIRQIDLTNYNDGDVLWLDSVIVGGLTNSVPEAPNLKIATAFVINATTNGSLFVRAEQGSDLHSDQRVQVSGLTSGNILTYNGTNNRWENSQPIDTNFANTDLSLTGNRSHLLDSKILNISDNNGTLSSGWQLTNPSTTWFANDNTSGSNRTAAYQFTLNGGYIDGSHPSGVYSITYNPLGIKLTSNTNVFDVKHTETTSNKIINYTSDLSASYTNRTLVDKEYVDNSAPNFANTDLTLTGNRSHELNGSTITFTNSATGFLRLNTFNEIFTFGKGDTTNLYFGNNVLRNVTTGLQNVIVGNDINGLTTGQVNTFVGFRAGQNINNSGNTFIGGFAGQSLTTGANNVIIGRSATFLTNSGGAVTNLENSIVIGETARVLNSGDTNTIIIGRNGRGYGSNTAVLGASDIALTRLRGRVEMNQITSSPTITDNSSYAIWFNSGVPTIRLKDSLGVESNITLWNNNNDGSGSGLDADLLDGQHGSYYLNKVNHTGNTRQTKSICIENPQIGDRIPFLQKPEGFNYTITRITASVLTDTLSSSSSNQVSYEISDGPRIYSFAGQVGTHTAVPTFSDGTIVNSSPLRFMWVDITNVATDGVSNIKSILITIEYTTDY